MKYKSRAYSFRVSFTNDLATLYLLCQQVNRDLIKYKQVAAIKCFAADDSGYTRF